MTPLNEAFEGWKTLWEKWKLLITSNKKNCEDSG